jgi:Ca-activated chloride channel family protein
MVDPAGLAVSDLRSSLHAVTTSGTLPGPVTVEIQPGERLDRDFILRYRVAKGAGAAVSAIAVPDADGEEGTYVVTVLPPLRASDAAARRDVVVVLDRSGSMGGWKLVAARRAAARIVDSLTSQDHFAVLAFDHVVERPPSAADDGCRLVPATDRNRYLAVEWLARLEARGGTELASALTEALADFGVEAGEVGDRSRSCVVVTDGQVGDDSELVQAATHTGGVRLFTVGIDRAVNAPLLRRLAEVSGGRCDLIESEDRLDEVMTALHRRINHPALEAVTVALPDMAALAGTSVPRGPTDVFAGVPLVVGGRYRGHPEGRAVVTAGRLTIEAPVTLVDGRAASSLSKEVPYRGPFSTRLTPVPAAAVWARGHLRDLEDRYAAAESGADLDAMAAEIVAVSLRHRVLCRFTAFVAIDSSGDLVGDVPHSIVQPVEVPSGWDMTSAASAPMMARPLMAWAPAPDTSASRPRVRLPGRHAGGGRFRPYNDVDPYQQRLDDLLARLDDDPPDGLAELAAEVRTLADDLKAIGAPADLLDAVEALAAALMAGDRRLTGKLVEELRRPGRRRWWRS